MAFTAGPVEPTLSGTMSAVHVVDADDAVGGQIPCADWNARTADLVLGPKLPLASTVRPWAWSSRWMAVTFVPRSPRLWHRPGVPDAGRGDRSGDGQEGERDERQDEQPAGRA